MTTILPFNLPPGGDEEEFVEEDEDDEEEGEDDEEEGEDDEEELGGGSSDEGESDEDDDDGGSDDDEKPKKKKYVETYAQVNDIFSELESAREKAISASKQLRATPPPSPLFGGAPPPLTQFNPPVKNPLLPPILPNKPNIVMVPGPLGPPITSSPLLPPAATPPRGPPPIVMATGPSFPPPLTPATSLPQPSQSATTVLGVQIQGTPVKGTALDPSVTAEEVKAKKSDEDSESHQIRSTLIDKIVGMGYRPGQASTFASMIMEKAKTQATYEQQMEEMLISIMKRL